MRAPAIVLAAWLACSAWVVEAAEPAPDIERGTVASADGVPIAWTGTAQGETTLLFLHGGFADSTFWRYQVPALADDYRVVTADVAGHGLSGHGRERWTMEAFGEDVRGVIEHLDLRRIVLVGNSMGGAVALEVARQMPEQIVAVIGVDTLNDATAVIDPEAFRAYVESVKNDFDTACRGMMKALFHDDADPTLVEEVRRKMCEGEPPTPGAILDAFVGYDRTAAFHAAKVPIRSLNGDLYPTNIEANQGLGDYDAVIMQGAGHYPMLERPEEFNRLLVTMIEALLETEP